MMDPATVDIVIVSVFKGLELLSKLAKGQEITEEDLKLETWEQTAARVRAAQQGKGGTA